MKVKVMKMSKTTNPFTCTMEYTGREYDKEYVRYYEKEIIADADKFDPKNPDQFLITTETTEYERLPIKEYINQFASKVGILNELRGVVSKQQMDEYIAEHQAQPGFVDLTKLPDTGFEVSQLAEKVDKVWASIPNELKGSLSKEEFLKTLTSEKLKSYIQSQVSIETEKKEEVK